MGVVNAPSVFVASVKSHVFATAASYNSSSNGLAISGGLNAGASAYITIGVASPSSANNTFMGRQATMDVDWYIAQ